MIVTMSKRMKWIVGLAVAVVAVVFVATRPEVVEVELVVVEPGPLEVTIDEDGEALRIHALDLAVVQAAELIPLGRSQPA